MTPAATSFIRHSPIRNDHRRFPFRGETSGVVFESILNRLPPPAVRLNPDIPPRLDEILQKALEKDREMRYQVAAEMRADLKRLRREADSSAAFPQVLIRNRREATPFQRQAPRQSPQRRDRLRQFPQHPGQARPSAKSPRSTN